jgi:hypothetical protein
MPLIRAAVVHFAFVLLAALRNEQFSFFLAGIRR